MNKRSIFRFGQIAVNVLVVASMLFTNLSFLGDMVVARAKEKNTALSDEIVDQSIDDDVNASFTVTTNPLYYLTELYNAELYLQNTSLKDDYDNNNQKHLIVVTGGFPIVPIIPGAVDLVGGGVDIYVDADDLYSAYHSGDSAKEITAEGSAQWVTIWVDAGFGLVTAQVPNSPPIGVGFTRTDRFPNEDDPVRRWELSGPSGCAFVQSLTSFTKSSTNGYDYENDPDLVLECTGVSGGLAEMSWNVMRFEVTRGAIEAYFDQIFQSLSPGIVGIQQIGNIGDEMIDNVINMDGNYNLSHKFSLSDVRKFSPLEDNVYPLTSSALIDYGFGGADINGDDRLDNYYLTNTCSILKTRGHTTGNNTDSYILKVVDISDGWGINAFDYDRQFPWDDHVFNLDDWPGNRAFNLPWGVTAPSTQMDGYVKFELCKAGLFGSCATHLDYMTVPLWANPENAPLPPEPPTLSHTPVTIATEGQAVQISATILPGNNNSEIEEARLYYSHNDMAGPYEGVRMTKGSNDLYTANIPSSSIMQGTVYYRFNVYDELFTTFPQAGDPYAITVSESNDPVYTISGYVYEGGSGLGDVWVTDGYRGDYSNSSGYYQITGVPDGVYTIRASKTGYSFSPTSYPNWAMNDNDLVLDPFYGAPTEGADWIFYPIADTSISMQHKYTRYGAESQLWLGFNSIDGYPFPDYFQYDAGMIKFDVSSLAGETIYDAELHIYFNQDDGQDIKVYAYRNSEDWSEDIRWSEWWETWLSGTPYEYVDGSGWTIWDGYQIKSWVEDWANGSASNYGFLMRPDTSGTIRDVKHGWVSKEGSSTYWPRLVVKTLNLDEPAELVVSQPEPVGGASPPFNVGQSVQWRVVSTNYGPGDADRHDVGFYLGTSPTDYSNRLDDDGIGPVLAGDSEDDDDFIYTFNQAGTWYLNVWVDDDNGVGGSGEVWETNDNNNKNSFGPFQVQQPNTPPTISNLPDRQLNEDTSSNQAIDLWSLSSDGESPHEDLTFIISNTPEGGAGVSIEANRYVNISPLQNWFGTTDVEITVYDPEGLVSSDSDTFTVTVNPINDEPWISPAIVDQSEGLDVPISIGLSDYEHDVEDSGIALDWTVTGFENGTVNGENSDDDILTFSPNAGFTGDDTVTLHLADSEGGEATQDITLTWTENDTPSEIDVQGNNQSILNGDTTPDPADDTEFGDLGVDSGSDTHTFTILNTGDAYLSVGTVTISDAINFSVTQPGSTTISGPSGSTEFSVTCDPATVGSHTAIVTIPNNDENPYTFTVGCTGVGELGTIIVEKQTNPAGDSTNFIFTGDVSGIIKDNEQIVVTDLSPGTYTSTETVPAGWNLTDITCNDANSTGDLQTKTTTFQLEAGETVKCVFTNTKSSPENAGDSPWTMYLQDAQRTSVSSFVGPNQPTLKWHYSIPENSSSTPAIAEDGTIYAGGNDKKVHAINPDGTSKWTYSVSDVIWNSPAITNAGVIYIGNVSYSTGELIALNPDGSLLWSYPVRGVRSSPAITSDGTIYVGASNARLYEINPDGTLGWEYQAGFMESYSSPAIGSDGVIYIAGSKAQNIHAVNPDGTTKWTYPLGGNAYGSPTVGSDGTIYIGGGYGNPKLYALNPDGTLKWYYETGESMHGQSQSAAIGSDGTIYFISGAGTLYAISVDGNLMWSYATGANPTETTPVIDSNGTIFFAMQDGKVYAVNPDGSEKWVFQTPAEKLYTSITIGADGTLYAGGVGGVYAIGDACTFSGNIDIQSRADDSGATFTAGAFSTTTDPSGDYELTVPADTYDVTADMDRFLDSERMGESCPAGGTNQLPAITLLGGDANDDCVINILDLAFMGARFMTSTSDPGFDPKADINADGTVNILDLTVAGANFLETCPVAWP